MSSSSLTAPQKRVFNRTVDEILHKFPKQPDLDELTAYMQKNHPEHLEGFTIGMQCQIWWGDAL